MHPSLMAACIQDASPIDGCMHPGCIHHWWMHASRMHPSLMAACIQDASKIDGCMHPGFIPHWWLHASRMHPSLMAACIPDASIIDSRCMHPGCIHHRCLGVCATTIDTWILDDARYMQYASTFTLDVWNHTGCIHLLYLMLLCN